MRVIEQHALDLPDVRLRETPVVVAHLLRHVNNRISGDSARKVDVRIGVAERKCARSGEDRLAAVQPGIPRARDGSPSAAMLIDEDNGIEMVDRLEAQNERSIAVR